MPKIVWRYGSLSLMAEFLLQKRGVFYYQRRVPTELQGHVGKALIRESLGTRDELQAAIEAAKRGKRDDALFAALRNSDTQGWTHEQVRAAARAQLEKLGLQPGGHHGYHYHDDPLAEFLLGKYPSGSFEAAWHGRWPDHTRYEGLSVDEQMSPIDRETMRLWREDPKKPQRTLSDALTVYLKEHDKGSHKKFAMDARRAIQFVIDVAGDLPLPSYTRQHAVAVRDTIGEGRSTGTVRRYLNSICAVVAKGLREFELDGVQNRFVDVAIPNENHDASERVPFTESELRQLAALCRREDDDIRHMVAIQLDTGARTGEVAGLRLQDVFLDAPFPYIWIREDLKAGRTLKTSTSERKIPLVGEALWGATRAVAEARRRKSQWLFPRYGSDKGIRNNAASGAVNKWIRAQGIEKTGHCFRHSIRDRLRATGAPKDIQDLIGGWGSRSIGEGYGEGYSMETLGAHMLKLVLPAERESP